MADRETTGADPAEREALRRSLYRPGATDEDRRRYAALAPVVEQQPQDPPPTLPRRPRWPAAALLAGVAAACVAALLLGRGEAPAPEVAETVRPADVTGTEVRAALVVPRPDAPRPTPIATSLAGVDTRLQRFHGRGPTALAIDTSTAQRQNGTLLVMMSSPAAGRVHWYATRPARQPGHAGWAEVVASGDADGTAVEPAYSVLVYDGSPPSRLAVKAPTGSRWTLTVAFLPRGRSDQ